MKLVSSFATIGLTLLASGPAWATVRAAKSCATADVQATVDAASEGDEVELPACKQTWTKPLTVDKGLTLRGKGEKDTLLTASGTSLVEVRLKAAGAFRLTGFGIDGTVSGEAISLEGTFKSFRIDHCAFTDIESRVVFLGYYSWYEGTPAITGLIDHVTYQNATSHPFMMVYGNDDAWVQPDDYGSANAVYIEDSTFTWTTPGVNSGILDGEHGARYVIRHNKLTNSQIQQHDTGSTPQARSTRKIEVYGNELFCTVPDCGNSAFGLRGGTGVIYDNVIHKGYEQPTFTQIYRVTATGGSPWPHKCDGTKDLVCGNFYSHCSGGDHRKCADASDCTGAGSCVDACATDADCPAGVKCVQMDGQIEPSGWPCRDQTGRGQDDPVTHVQASSPLYWWNNKSEAGAALSVYVASANAAYIQEGRDYCNHDPTTACGSKGPWTFAPYPYPHPLAGGPGPGDAGPVDASVPDGGGDAGGGADAAPDGGAGAPDEPADSGGCGCVTPGGAGEAPSPLVLLAALAACARLRRPRERRR